MKETYATSRNPDSVMNIDWLDLFAFLSFLSGTIISFAIFSAWVGLLWVCSIVILVSISSAIVRALKKGP